MLGPGKDDEATGRAITLLLEVSDYRQFREMMMFTKREIEEGEKKHAEDQLDGVSVSTSQLASLDIHGMMDMCATLATAGNNEEGWTNLLTLDWMKIDKRPVRENSIKFK
jgi:hypothetical protein